jgi:hypothetical protein
MGALLGLSSLSCILLTPHRLDGIRPLDHLAAKGLSSNVRGYISTLDTCGPDVKLESQISIPVSIYILQLRL